ADVRRDARPRRRSSRASPARARNQADARDRQHRRATSGDFASREGIALALANELVCADLTAVLEELVEEHGDGEVLVDGEPYRYHASGSATYHSLAGPLHLRRPSFRQA